LFCMRRNSTLLCSILGGWYPLGIGTKSRKNNLNMKPIITRTKRFFFGWTLVLVSILGSVSNVTGQTLVAGWDFQTTTTGGTAAAASPATPKVYSSNFGLGTIFFEGTNGSSNWFVPVSGSTGTELNAFGGTTVNAGPGFSVVTTGTASLALVGGTAQAANGKSAVFTIDMTGYINLNVTYAAQRTSSGFTTHIWEYSTNGVVWSPVTSILSIPSAFGVITLPTITGLNGSATALLRLTVNGATTSSGNNRIDNIQFNATAGFPFSCSIPFSTSFPQCVSDDNSAPFLVDYSYGGTFNPGNILTAQLSSSTGSFASPVNVGTLVTTASNGTISANVPAGTASGTGYRIRVVSSDPTATSNNNGADLTIDKVVASASNSGPVCAGLSLQLNSSGGVAYIWTGPNGFTDFTQNPTIATTVAADSGVYLVTAVSFIGCADTASTLAIVQTCGCLPPTISSQVNEPSCNGGSNGSIDITVSGGIGPYTFLWSTGANSEDITGLSAGTFSVIVTDNVLCVDTFYISVGQPSLISPSVVVTNPGCPGASDGSINLSVSGGTPGYTYLWDTGATTEDISGLVAGLYSVTITDNNACVTYAFGVLTDPGVFTISSVGYDVACAGLNNGAINVTASNDTVNMTNPGVLISEFMANPAGADSSKEWVELIATKFIDFSATPYTIITANNGGGTTKGWVQGGAASATTNGTFAFEISSGIVVAGDVFYVGGSNMVVTGNKLRTIDVSTTGGDGGIGSPTAGGILGNGGGNADGIAVFNMSAASLDSNSVPVDAIFFGTGTGTAVVNAGVDGFTLPTNDRYSGGRLQTTSFLGPDAGANDIHVIATGGYNSLSGAYTTRTWTTSVPASHGSSAVSATNSNTYLWSNGATSEDLSGLAAGTYTVTATTNTGCTATLTTIITAPSSIILNDIVQHVNCFGGNTGAIDITVSGGQTPYTYLWNDGDLNEDRNAILAGTYTITVTDANGCTETGTYSINQPNDITYSTIVTHPSCFGGLDGAIDLTVNGGTPPYTFSWSNGDLTEDISSQPAGFYFFNIEDANTCVTGGIEFINDPAQIVINNFSPNNGGSGVLVVINGSGFTGATSVEFDGVPASSFTVISDFQIDAVVPPGADTGFVSVFTSPTCFSVSIDTFFYNPAACVPPSLSALATNASCFGASDGSIDLSVSGGFLPYTFTWSNGANSEDIAGVTAGVYSVIVSDATNCPDTLYVTVGEPGSINGAGAITSVTCNGASDGAIDLTVSGGTPLYTFLWSNGANTEDVTGLPAGVYTVTIIDNNSCAGQTTFTLLDPPVLTLSLSGTDPLCGGASNGNITSTVLGGTPSFTYLWSDASTNSDLLNVVAGTYTLTVTDASLCSISMSHTLTDPAPFTLSVTSATDVDCFGGANGSINITASNDTSMAPSNPGLLISEFLADPFGSDATFEWVELIATQTIDFSATPYTIVAANNGAATTKGWRNGGSLTYAFQISSGIVNAGDVFYVGGSAMAPTGLKLRVINTFNTPGDGFGNANITGTFGNGGTNADGIAVFNVPSSAIDSNSVPTDAVFYGSALGNAIVNGGVDGYTLPTNDLYFGGRLALGAFFAPNSVQGSYFKATGSYNAIAGTYPSSRVWSIQPAFTDGISDVTVTAPLANTYLWSNGAVTQDISGLIANTYTVTATNLNGCTATANVLISQPNDLTISSVTPGSGSVGNPVTIFGTGFTGVDFVNFNGVSAVFSIVNDGEISAAVPAGATTGLIELINASCDTTVSASPFVISTSSATLKLKLILEGYHDGVGGMTPTLFNNGLSAIPTEVDSIVVELRDALSPTTIAHSATAVVNTNDSAMITFPGSIIGNSYYIAVFSRNAVQTWSDLPVTFGSTTNYDFTTAASQAYLSNQILLTPPGVYAFFSGDVNQDEVIDIFDQIILDNDIFNFASGYLVTDLTGEGSIDVFDQIIMDNNIFNFIGSIHP
jgi:SprB repeat